MENAKRQGAGGITGLCSLYGACRTFFWLVGQSSDLGRKGGGDGCYPSLVYQAVWMRLLLRVQNTVISGKVPPLVRLRDREMRKYHGENRPGQCVWQSQPSVVLEGYAPLWQGRCWARWLSPVKLPAWPYIWSQSVIFLKNLV